MATWAVASAVYRFASVWKYSASPRRSAGVFAFAALAFSSWSVGWEAPAPP